MVIARYVLPLLLVSVILLLSACGNTVIPLGDTKPANDHGQSHTVPPEPLTSNNHTRVLDLQQSTDIESLGRRLTNRRIVFIGEAHDNFAHHKAQLELIKTLHESGAELAIGMEMFQQPFQYVLDDYIAGTTSEAEMLRETEWFKRWVFDYRLYRPILNFAREQGIPIVALNVAKEIIGEVSENGIDALDESQRAQVPQEIDYSDQQYSERLKEVFEQHAVRSGRTFERFMQVQLVWDEGMAERASRYLQQHPEKLLVVLAGNGHLMHGSGIPNRVTRRQSVARAIVLPADNLDFEPGIADYLVFPKPESLPPAALIGIYMQESDQGVTIGRVAEGGAADRAGIKADDRILSFDGADISTSADVRIALLDKRPGDRVQMTVQRSGFLFGEKRIELELELGE